MSPHQFILFFIHWLIDIFLLVFKLYSPKYGKNIPNMLRAPSIICVVSVKTHTCQDVRSSLTDLLPSVPLCVHSCPPNVSWTSLLECVGEAVSDLWACVEVVWRAWLCPELRVCQYLPPSSLHVPAFTRSLGSLTLRLSLVSALQQPNIISVCVCVSTAEGDVQTRAW